MGVAIYSDEFKDGAVKHVLQGGHPVQEVAKRLGVSSKSIYMWLRERGRSRTTKNAEPVDSLRGEVTRLKAELKRTQEERGVLGAGIQVKYAFIHEHRTAFRVTEMCRVLRVHRSGYYSWQVELVSARQKDDDRLVERVKAVHEEFSGSYGSPLICTELRESGETCGENRVAKLMKANKIEAKRRYRRPKYRYSKPSLVTPNRLDQDFDVVGLDRVWVTDITYISTSEGWLYRASSSTCSRGGLSGGAWAARSRATSS